MSGMKLYVWEESFSDYSDGLAVVVAPDSETARDLLRKKIGYNHPDLAKRPDEYELTEVRVFYVHGGG